MAAACANPITTATIAPQEDLVAPPGLNAAASGRAPGLRVQSMPVLTRQQQRVYMCLGLLWIVVNAAFWVWWLQPERMGVMWLYALMTAALAYDATFLPTAYLFFVGRMRHPRPFVAPPGLRVALVTLCVPAQESLSVIQAQLEAMVGVQYPHDSWILDEGNDSAVRVLASRLGVRYFSRAGVQRYNQATPPFKARTKAGNVNAWLDAQGANYDYFVQFDIDHCPQPEYLDRVLGYFHDRKVAWVQAPSVYGNLDNWIARGAAEQELVLQGPLQRGFFGFSETPFIIGSHCTYRMSAVREIGGFAPTRAEDHLDTVMLAARGYRGVFVPEIIARGLGPDSFETYLRQQFAWAMSMLQVLGGHVPSLFRHLGWRQLLQFLFAETWYALFGLSMLILFLTPAAALLVGQEPARASLVQFVGASAPVALTSLLIWWWTRRWHMPVGLNLSWRGVVLHVARWPIVVWALVNVVLRVRHPYMITPKKGNNELPGFALRTQAIYLVGAAINLATVWLRESSDSTAAARGYILFAMLAAAYMLLVVIVNMALDHVSLRRLDVSWYRAVGLRVAPLVVVVGAVAALALSVTSSAPTIVAAARWVDDSTPVASAPPAEVAEPTTSDTSASTAGPVAAPALLGNGMTVGAYDPSRSLDSLPLTIRSVYVRQSDPSQLAPALEQAGAGGIALVTIEPFPTDPNTPVLESVASGQADTDLIQIADIVRDSGAPTVLIRWAQEMDLHLLYPWSAEDPDSYRVAFRHVVSVFRAEGATNVQWVWSPAGQGNALAFYPGDDVVDYVGLTVLGDATWDSELGYASRQSLADILQPRYDAVVATQKPIIIAELGVSGTPSEQAEWLSAGARAMDQFPRVVAVSYFNDQNAANNWRDSQPDWRLSDPRALAPLLAVDSGGNG